MILLAIDPGSNKTGVALFKGKKLQSTETFEAPGERPDRTASIVKRLILKHKMQSISIIVMEDPLLKGKANNSMQRHIGALEHALLAHYKLKKVEYIYPQTVKAILKAGQDKKDMAWAAYKLLTTDEEKDILAGAIEREEWDATDAVAIGLAYFKQTEKIL